jgi:hypothetical protein
VLGALSLHLPLRNEVGEFKFVSVNPTVLTVECALNLSPKDAAAEGCTLARVFFWDVQDSFKANGQAMLVYVQRLCQPKQHRGALNMVAGIFCCPPRNA